jgi:N-acetylmuramoyl-L-alanine amidase
MMKIINVVNPLPKGAGTYKRRPLSAITKIAVHHSATRTGSAEAFARYHVDHNGWPGIGYHYVVEQDGTVKKTNNLSTVSYHVGESNRLAVGVCFTGHYDIDTPPQVQLDAGAQLIAELTRGLPQLGIDDIWGHTQFPGYAHKSCPGTRFPLPRLKGVVESILNA